MKNEIDGYFCKDNGKRALLYTLTAVIYYLKRLLCHRELIFLRLIGINIGTDSLWWWVYAMRGVRT
jgi:hypothetical protein